MYLSDLWSDPWMVILSQTHIEYSLWLTSQHTSGNVVFYCTLYICMLMCIRRRRRRCTGSPLSYLLSPVFIDPIHTGGIYHSCVHVSACMWHVSVCGCDCLCLRASLCVGIWLCEGVRLSEASTIASPSTTPLIAPLMVECIIPPLHPQNWWCCRPKIPFVALPSRIIINNHDIIPFLSIGRSMLIDSMAPGV